MASALDFLNPINALVEAGKKVVDVIMEQEDRKERETASIIADLASLMEELRRTHSTIVKWVSPLRRIPKDEGTFGDDFKKVYYDFRDFYDDKDWLDERTHCNKIEGIQVRMEKREPRFGSKELWQKLYQSLETLSGMDKDIIEEKYEPFMASFDATMRSIEGHVDKGDIPQAMAEREAFLNSLGPEYDKNKAMLQKMNDIVGKLTAWL